jgi:hypothetical protein
VGSVLEEKLKQELVWDDFEISFPASTDVTAIRAIVGEFLSAPDLIDRIRASEKLLDQLKFSACLPPALAKRAVYGRRDLQVLPQIVSLANDSADELNHTCNRATCKESFQ